MRRLSAIEHCKSIEFIWGSQQNQLNKKKELFDCLYLLNFLYSKNYSTENMNPFFHWICERISPVSIHAYQQWMQIVCAFSEQLNHVNRIWGCTVNIDQNIVSRQRPNQKQKNAHFKNWLPLMSWMGINRLFFFCLAFFLWFRWRKVLQLDLNRKRLFKKEIDWSTIWFAIESSAKASLSLKTTIWFHR